MLSRVKSEVKISYP